MSPPRPSYPHTQSILLSFVNGEPVSLSTLASSALPGPCHYQVSLFALSTILLTSSSLNGTFPLAFSDLH